LARASFQPSQARRSWPFRVLQARENFGLITIDWQAGEVGLALMKGLGGLDVATVSLTFGDLGLGR